MDCGTRTGSLPSRIVKKIVPPLILAFVVVVSGCSSGGTDRPHSPDAETPEVPEVAAERPEVAPELPEVAIDPYRELVIVDPSVVNDARASNANAGTWSFRRTVQRLAGSDEAGSRMVEAWLRSYRQKTLNGFPLEDRAGVESLLGSGDGAWPRTSTGALDLSRAPFRLLAIVNRLDLAEHSGPEVRFVYGMVDPFTGAAERMTVGFEFRLPPLGTADDVREWARRWHELSQWPLGEGYRRALEALTESAGDDLAACRVNEAVFGSRWQLREWRLDRLQGEATLTPAPLPQTPDPSLNGSESLARFMLDNAEAIRAGALELPAEMRAGAAPERRAWRFPSQPEVDDELRHRFALQTCNGCHSSETNSAQGFFHVSPFGPPGVSRLSPFLTESELPRRAAFLARQLGARVPAPPPDSARAPRYSVASIPAEVNGPPVALDSRGRVLGNSPLGPWIWDGSVQFLLAGQPAPERFTATAFNSTGDVVGSFLRDDGTQVGFLLRDGKIVELTVPGGSHQVAKAINDEGDIALEAEVPAGLRTFLLSGGTAKDLGALGGGETLTFAMNGPRLTGHSGAGNGVFKAFLWDGVALRGLESLGGRFSRGQGLNEFGHVAGFSELVAGDPKIHAFLSTGPAPTDLGILPGLHWSSATSINRDGVVVGAAYDDLEEIGPDTTFAAFVYREGRMWNLNQSLVGPAPLLKVALSVNDAGQILCIDSRIGIAGARGFVLTPVP